MRVSIGSAAVLGLKKLKQQALPRTIYLMNSGGCQYNCSFCAQANQATARQDKLSRISWPEFFSATVFQALKQKQSNYHRICLQVVNTPNILSELPALIKTIKSANPIVPLSVNLRTLNFKELDKVFLAGADRIGLSIDAVKPDLFKTIRHGQLTILKKFIIKAAKKYPNKIATHLIVGLGETEQDIVKMISQLHKNNITIALFAFTPVLGAHLARQNAPALSHYHRIQVILYLIRNNYQVKLKYNKKQQIIDFGMSATKLKKILQASNAFETSGCTDCNRPYYNERASDKQLYNYPIKITVKEFLPIFSSIYDY